MRGIWAVSAALLVSCTAWALEGDETTRVIYPAGFGRKVEGTVSHGVFRDDLKSWVDPATGTSAELASGCGGVVVEARLLGYARSNYLLIGLKNASKSDWHLMPSAVKMTFGSGRERMPEMPGPVGVTDLRPGNRAIVLVPFPQKADFKGENSLDASVTLNDPASDRPCELVAHIKRDPSVDLSPDTYLERTGFYTVAEMGASLFAAGDLSRLASAGFSAGAYLYGYPSYHHGIWLGVAVDGMGSGAGRSDLLGAIEIVPLGYSYRTPLGDRFQLSYDVAPAIHGFATQASSSFFDSLEIAFVQRVALDWRFARITNEGNTTDHLLGLVVYGLAIPSARLSSGASAAGANFGILLRYVMAQ